MKRAPRARRCRMFARDGYGLTAGIGSASNEERAMQSHEPDRLTSAVWLMLAALGAVLAVVGWYRWAS